MPRLNFPFVIVTVTEFPSKDDLICEVISSVPSSVCSKYVEFSGTILLKYVSISVRTVGSAFSLIVSEAEVCLIKICTRPTDVLLNSGICEII